MDLVKMYFLSKMGEFNYHSNRKWILWRCISYRKWEIFKAAMLVHQRGYLIKKTMASTDAHFFFTVIGFIGLGQWETCRRCQEITVAVPKKIKGRPFIQKGTSWTSGWFLRTAPVYYHGMNAGVHLALGDEISHKYPLKESDSEGFYRDTLGPKN